MKPLNPIMAVLAFASVGAFSLRALAADGKEPAAVVKEPAGVAVEAENKNSINRLTEVFAKDPSAVKDAGDRLTDFILKEAGGKSFVADGVSAEQLEKVTQGWAKGQTPGDLATLYFVVGTGDSAPSWVTLDPLLSKTVLPKRDAEGRLRHALDRFTVKGGAQITQKTEKTAVRGFLGIAAAEAKTIFKQTRPMPVIVDSANANNNTGVQMPNTGRGAGSQLASRQYGFDDLYINGAVVKEIAGPKDKNSRKISMKLYSKRVDGVIVNEIGIFDITDSPDDIFGQRFPIGTGKKSFILDDRKPGHKGYELEFGPVDKDGNRSITFARPDGAEGGIKTSVADLFLNRADHAARMGNIVNVGGQEFYVLPQGGARSALALFPKGAIDARKSGGNARLLEPGLFAEVGKIGPNGRNQNVEPGEKGGPMLGKVGQTDYKLVFNHELGLWEAKEGVGNPPVPPKKPEGDPAPGGTTPGGTTPGGTTPGGGDPNKPEMSIADLEKLLLLEAYCKKFPKDTELMADGLKGKYGLVMCNPTGKPEGNQAILLVPKKVWATQQMVFSSIPQNNTLTPPTPAAVLVKGRIVDNYLVLQFESQTQYLDLRKKTDAGFELVGLVANKDVGGPPAEAGTERPGMNNIVIFIDALRNYMGLKDNDPVYAEVQKRVKEHIGEGKPVELEARFAGSDLVVIAKGSGPKFQIWPKVNLPNQAPASTQYAHLGGPTNVFEREVSSMDAPFEDKFDIPSSYQLVRVGAKTAGEDIVLYEAKDPTGKEDPKKHYLSFKYWGFDTVDANPESAKVKKLFRQKFFEVFNKDNPLPEKRDMKGLTDPKDVQVRGQLAYRFIAGTTPAKGVLAVFQNAQLTGEQKEGKANCVGPLVWWGVATRDAALKICKADKF